jgi:tetratricopeptide (TPR) repeat protein
VLLIFTYRPEFVHTWGSRSYHSQVTLNRLSNRESLAMLSYLLGTEEVEPQLQDLVLEKTEGVPFFIEEFIRSLKDLRIIERKNGTYALAKDIKGVSIPGTIQDVIMARVDSLSEAARKVLQAGSAIEREFGFELIHRVTGLSEGELLSHLSALKDAELLYERGIYPNSTFVFRHALTREVVYNSILMAKKKKLHIEIADAIEEINKDNLDEYYEALAEHYTSGESYEKGAEYCRRVAKKSEKAGSMNDAIPYSEKRVACLEKLPRSNDVEKQIMDARITLGMYCTQMNYWVEAREAVDPVVELALKRDYKKGIGRIYNIIGICNFVFEGDFPKAFKYLEAALKIGEELNDIITVALSEYWIAGTLAWNGEFDKALGHYQRALEFGVAANDLLGIVEVQGTIAWWVYGYQGKCDLAYQTSQEALRLAEESGDIYSKIIPYTSHGFSCLYKGFLDEAGEHLLKASDFCDRIKLFHWGSFANFGLGEVYFERGEYAKCQEFYLRAISLAERIRLKHSHVIYFRVALARAKVLNNNSDVDLESLYERAAENTIKSIDGLISRYIAEILLNIDDEHVPEAEKWVKKAIETDNNNGTKWELGMAHALYAELLKRKGDLPGAKEKLGTAIDICRECGADGRVKKYEQDLAGLQKTGN